MGVDVCFYFQVHQPWRLRHYRFLEVGKNHNYFDDEKNASIMRKVADKCYLPMNNLLFDLLTEFKGKFKISFSISGTAMEQMNEYAPEVITSFKRLFDTGQAELLSETSHHSLAALYSPTEFRHQVEQHRKLAAQYFIPPSKVFRNTELISSNEIAKTVSEMGYEAMLMEGADHILQWRSPLFPYRIKGAGDLICLLKHYQLSDDIAFRFSNRNWKSWPLTSEKFAEWIRLIEIENPAAARGERPFFGLFMDYETFGEHQWQDTGIFNFMRALPGQLLKNDLAQFKTPSEVTAEIRNQGKHISSVIDAPVPFSWADVERDLSAWRGNPIQDAALRAIYRLEPYIRKLETEPGEEAQELVETWRKLLTSDHYYYMCTKYFADGDVHKYFNPFNSPYDAHILFMNVVADMTKRLGAEERTVA